MTVFRSRWGSFAYRFWSRASRPRSPYERAGYRTKYEAERAEAEHKGRVGYRARGPEADRGREIQLVTYATAWLERLEAGSDLAPGTIINYRERLDNHVLPALGRVPLRDLTKRHVRDFLQQRRADGHAKNSVRLMRAALSAVLADAEDDGLVVANVALQLGRRRARGVAKMTPADLVARIRPMDQATRDRVLAVSAVTVPRYVLLFELLAKTGMRPSEAYAVRPHDLDLVQGRVRVDRGWVRGAFRATKTYEQRWVDLPMGLAGALARHPPNRGEFGDGAENATLFTTDAGTPLDASRVRKAFRATLRDVRLQDLEATGMDLGTARKELRREGWRPPHRLYDLRHTYASLRLLAGAPVTYVAAQLGHATPVTTFRHYARWMPTAGRQWVEGE